MPITTDAVHLNLLGAAQGTDKTFLGNDYLTNYARLFAPYRDADIAVLEIGVASGGSLRTWKRYFSRATIIGIDIAPEARQHAGDRIIIEVGSQADPDFLRSIAEKYKPAIIIDDGSHVSDHQIISLETLFQLMPEGGIYVIEDIFFQVNPATSATFGPNAPLMIDLLCGLARDVSSWLVDCPERQRIRAAVGHHMGRIEFLPAAVALHRYVSPMHPAEVLPLVRDALEGSGEDEAWRFLFYYALRHRDIQTAELAAKSAFAITGRQTLYDERMAQILDASDPGR